MHSVAKAAGVRNLMTSGKISLLHVFIDVYMLFISIFCDAKVVKNNKCVTRKQSYFLLRTTLEYA